MSAYPVPDAVFGLTEDEQALRQSIRTFAEKELAPYAQAIDKDNGWSGLRDFWKKLGNQGLLGITAPCKIFLF